MRADLGIVTPKPHTVGLVGNKLAHVFDEAVLIGLANPFKRQDVFFGSDAAPVFVKSLEEVVRGFHGIREGLWKGAGLFELEPFPDKDCAGADFAPVPVDDVGERHSAMRPELTVAGKSFEACKGLRTLVLPGSAEGLLDFLRDESGKGHVDREMERAEPGDRACAWAGRYGALFGSIFFAHLLLSR